jgi:ATP-dependent protease ClpP protease subunit
MLSKKPEPEEEEESGEVVEVVGTDVFFTGPIDEESIQELVTNLKKLENKLLKQAVDLQGYTPKIRLFIRSDGGDVFAGFSAMDHISRSRLHVTTVADGCCASAATFLLLAGHRRAIGAHGYVLIHQLATDGFWGKYEELRDEMKNCDKFMKSIRSIYESKTRLPSRKLNKMLKRDIYLDASMCKKYSIVDEIMS